MIDNWAGCRRSIDASLSGSKELNLDLTSRLERATVTPLPATDELRPIANIDWDIITFTGQKESCLPKHHNRRREWGRILTIVEFQSPPYEPNVISFHHVFMPPDRISARRHETYNLAILSTFAES